MISITGERTYLHNHELLRGIWFGPGRYFFAFIELNQQQHLRDYYLFDQDLTDDELLASRQQVIKEEPSIRDQAEGALKFLHEYVRTFAIRLVQAEASRQVSGSVVASPEPELFELAQALHDHALDIERRRNRRDHGAELPPL